MIRLEKFQVELDAAGIPTHGVVAVGAKVAEDVYEDCTIQFRAEATQQQQDEAAALKAAHDATDYESITRAAGRDGLANLPGWATWSATEAEDWIQTNVTDLASAKTALKAMAKAIVYLRNQEMGQ